MIRRKSHIINQNDTERIELVNKRKKNNDPNKCGSIQALYKHFSSKNVKKDDNIATKIANNKIGSNTLQQESIVPEPIPAKIINYNTFIELCKKNYGQNFDKKNFVDYTDDAIAAYSKGYLSEYPGEIAIINTLLSLNGNFIFRLVNNYYFINMILKKGYNINVNAIDKNNNNFLFYIDSYGILIEILESKLVFDVNLYNKKNNSFMYYIWSKNNGFPSNHMDMTRLINALIKRNYNFNMHECGMCMLECIYKLHRQSNDLAPLLLSISDIDITCKLDWLRNLLKNDDFKYDLVKDAIDTIVERPDYKKFLLMMLISYQYQSIVDDFIYIIEIINNNNNNKLIKMLTYANDAGDTVLHIAGKYHHKKILCYIMNYSKKNVQVGPNIHGKYPADIYDESKFSKRIKTTSIATNAVV